MQNSKRKLEEKCETLVSKVRELKDELSDNVYYKVHDLALDIPIELTDLYGKRMKHAEDKPDSVYKEKMYSKQIQTFALTLYSYSPKAYEFIRNTFR